MIKTNPDKYAAAAQLIQDGALTVDILNGTLSGPRGVYRNLSGGYPVARLPRQAKRTVVLIHRVIWESVNGPVPDGMTINHRNGVKTDNRIANLELATVAENVQHAFDHALMQPLRGEEATNVILTEAEVRTIYRRCKTERVARIARDYGVAYWTISSIKHGHNWAHITGHRRGDNNAA